MKKNSKGFVLIESLVVSVFVASIFIIIYINVIPILAKYEIRKRYDDIDSKYAAHYVRNLIIYDSLSDNIFSFDGSYKRITCSDFGDYHLCNEVVSALKVQEMYITSYITTGLKNSTISDKNLRDYVKVMPSITTNPYPSYNAVRLIIKRDINDLAYFANIEVVKK